MATDHSRTYTDFSVKNIIHRQRLKDIVASIRAFDFPNTISYADLGCSNGFITNVVREEIGTSVVRGFDHNKENIEAASASFSDIEFSDIDLNEKTVEPQKFDLVTSFEVLEHVGDVSNALHNIYERIDTPGVGLVTVPIEKGIKGLAKFVVKFMYGYKLDELPKQENLYRKYLWCLVTNGQINRFRDQRSGWGTHFGFDYRELDMILEGSGISYEARNKGFTRFYILRKT